MNKIKTTYHQTEYTRAPHLVMEIDGNPLNKIIETVGYNGHMKGLIPTLLRGWMDNPREEEVVWDRLDLSSGSIKLVPILMCPDDCDFSCTVIIAEMNQTGNTVRWNKLGVDETATRSSNPQTIGRNVKWFENIGPYEFDKSEFETCLDRFKTSNS